MPRILYIFPHPDDESFGPGPTIARQRREGHEVCLLTLTRGEATSQRAKYGYSKEEMGRVRYAEMQGVAEALDLTDLTVLDFADGGLDTLDPRVLEGIISNHLRQMRPQVVVTYPVHGISGHPDHLVTHAVVKRAFCALRAEEGAAHPKRLAFLTLSEEGDADRPEHLKGSPPEAIDCVVPFEASDLERGRAALACYETYQDVIEKHQPLKQVTGGVSFELFQEAFDPPVEGLFEGVSE